MKDTIQFENCLVVDDHPLVCSAIESILTKANRFNHVHTETDSLTALRFLKENDVDFLILDVGLEDSDGFEFLRRAKAHGYNGKTLYVSANDVQLYSETAFKLGADGYITKSEDISLILDAIDGISHGYSVFKFLNKDETNTIKDIKLSKRETIVFKYLVEGYGNKEISEILSLSAKTISTYKTRILNKYNVKSIVELINFKAVLGE